MSAEIPPPLNPDPGPSQSISLGQLGMRLSLVAPAVVLLFMILRPG